MRRAQELQCEPRKRERPGSEESQGAIGANHVLQGRYCTWGMFSASRMNTARAIVTPKSRP